MDTITAPATALRIPLAAITASKTNPRKRFDQAKLDELADSIKRHDVLQPILLRSILVRDEEKLGAHTRYEIVAGERRFRAAVAAGLADIPATVRELTDAEVLEIQVVENLQREDVHELEEAEGYERLLKCTHANGERYTVDEIAAKVGKSRSYVFARLKLCSLCPEARKAFYAGDLDASRALLIARIGHHDTQRQALKEITEGQYGRGPLSYREAQRYIVDHFMLQLKSAPFDITDARLVPKVGACGPCPKRTGNQADLFGDVKGTDVCTDPKCFDNKRQAHYCTAAVQLEAQGFKVITGDAAKKALPGWEHRREGSYVQFSGGYEQFEGTTYVAGRGRPVKSLFADDYKPTKLQHPLTGEIFNVVTQQAIAAAAKKLPEPKKGKSSGGATRQHRQPEKLTPEQIYQRKLVAAIAAKAPGGGIEIEQLRWIALDMQDMLDIREHEAVAEAFFPAPTDPKLVEKHDALDRFGKALKTMNNAELSRVVFTMLAARGLDGPAWLGGERVDVLKVALKRAGVDPAKVKKQIADEAKAAAAKQVEAKATAKKGLGRGMPAVKEPKKGLAALGIESAGSKKLKAKK